MAIVFTIAAVTKRLLTSTLQISRPRSGRATMRGDIISDSGAYRPSIGDAVTLVDGATTLFAGLIDGVLETGTDGPTADIVNHISCVDYNAYADYRVVDKAIPAGTLKSFLQALDDYVTGFGVTLDAAQANGASLDAQTFSNMRLSDALDILSKITGWVWEIDFTKTLRMYDPATSAASFNIVTGNGNAFGDVTIEPSRKDFSDHVIVRAGTGVRDVLNERHNGDGSTRVFVLNVPLLAMLGTANVTDGATTNQPVGLYGVDTMSWTYDPARNALIHSGGSAISALGYVTFNYRGQYPFTVTSGSGNYDAIVDAPDIFEYDAAQALADALYALMSTTIYTVRYQTRVKGLKPGQSQTINIASRNFNQTCIITEIDAVGEAGNSVVYSVTAVKGTTASNNWRDDWKGLLGGGGGGGVMTVSGVPIIAGNSIVGWYTDTADITHMLLPQQDSYSAIGDPSHRVLKVTVADGTPGNTGLVFRGVTPTTGKGMIGYGYHVSVPFIQFQVVNDSGAGGTAVLIAYKEGLSGVFHNITFTSGAGLRLLDNDHSHEMAVDLASNLTAARTLSLVTGDASRTITLSGNPTLADWFDQAVKAASNPTFAALTTTTTTVKPGSASITAKVGGMIYQSTTGVGNVGTGEDDLISFTTAANVLATNGDRLFAEFSGRFAANGNGKRVRIRYGSTLIVDMGAGLSPNAVSWRARVTIARTGAATQRVTGEILIGSISGTVVFIGNTTAAETLSGTVVLKATGEATSNDDVFNDEASVVWMPAA